MVCCAVNRELTHLLLFAAAGALLATPAAGREEPVVPTVAIEPIEARNLLAPVEDARTKSPAYRLDPGLGHASGNRARLSLDVGDSTLFAITGRLSRQRGAIGPLDEGHARVLGQRRDSGKVYGAGISRTVRGIDVSATYQYSKVSAEQAGGGEAIDGGPGKSHSLRATARVRFTP